MTKLDEIQSRVNTIQRLLDDPHPGLFMWCEAFAQAMDDLYTAWKAPESEELTR
jgi:hypothetical protein